MVKSILPFSCLLLEQQWSRFNMTPYYLPSFLTQPFKMAWFTLLSRSYTFYSPLSFPFLFKPALSKSAARTARYSSVNSLFRFFSMLPHYSTMVSVEEVVLVLFLNRLLTSDLYSSSQEGLLTSTYRSIAKYKQAIFSLGIPSQLPFSHPLLTFLKESTANLKTGLREGSNLLILQLTQRCFSAIASLFLRLDCGLAMRAVNLSRMMQVSPNQERLILFLMWWQVYSSQAASQWKWSKLRAASCSIFCTSESQEMFRQNLSRLTMRLMWCTQSMGLERQLNPFSTRSVFLRQCPKSTNCMQYSKLCFPLVLSMQSDSSLAMPLPNLYEFQPLFRLKMKQS